MNLFIIAKSNIKKNKSMSFTLVALILFATILLYIGSSVILDIDTFLDKKNKELNGADFIVLTSYQYEDTIHKIIQDMGNCEEYEHVQASMFSSTFKNESNREESQSIGCIFLNADVKETVSKLKIIDEAEHKLSNSIILPYYLKVAKGYKTGDEISIKNGSHERKYIVYGFAEDIMFATPSNISYYKCYVFQGEFEQVYKDYQAARSVLVKTKLTEGTDFTLYCDQFLKNANSEMKDAINNMIAADYPLMKVGDSIFLNLIMAIMIVFSFIILLIALTVIRFAIVTHIEANMKNIGTMEALGYTARELIRGTILQFVIIAIVGIVLGLAIAMSSLGIVTNFVSVSVGLIWKAGIIWEAVLIDFVVVLCLVTAIAYLTARKLKKITPLVALREGINTHSFKKNHLPLYKSPFHINITIGLKTLLHNQLQNIIIMIIVTLMSFVCVFAFTTNYNFNVDNTAFLRLIGLEKSQIMVSYYGEDAPKVFEEIGKMEHIRKTIRRNAINIPIRYDDRELSPNVSISNDYEHVETKTIVKGRYPIHDNEIAMTGLVLKQLKAKLGDVVRVGGEGIEQEFIIVGITQHISNLGKGANITEAGMKRINPDYIPSGLYVYLDQKENTAAVMKAIEKKYADLQIDISNREKNFDTILASFNNAIVILCIACFIITLSIITLILYLLIKIKIMKERMRLGVAKALGYTTGQLVLQMIVSFCPVCILGALVGTILATYLINPAFALILSISGIQNCHFIINPLLTLITFIFISMYSILITAIVARSIRKITPRELFL